MLIRTVRMTLREDGLDAFLRIFERAAPLIRRSTGCRHLELWQDADHPLRLTTYSVWESQTALSEYRSSELFASTWSEARRLFSDRADASSHVLKSPSPTPRPASE